MVALCGCGGVSRMAIGRHRRQHMVRPMQAAAQGGLTALMRRLRGISSAAANETFEHGVDSETEALPCIGCITRMPVVRVIDPRSRRRSFANRARLTCPIIFVAKTELLIGIR
jgi:hypothetical protein